VRHVRSWKERCASGLAVLSLLMLSHCGGTMDVEAQVPEAPGPQAPVTRGQELVSTLTFAPSADARVEAALPTTNFGGSGWLGADLSPRMESYLRFSVSGLTGPVSSAKLRLYATDGSSDGPRVYRSAGGWTEGGLTWNTRPALGSGALDDKGSISTGTWVEFDVTSAVSGNGELNLALIATSSDGADFSSRESGAASQRPQLVVTFSPVDCLPRRERYTYEAPVTGDTYVSQSSPSTNFGRAPVLLVDGSPRLESYLQVDVFSRGLTIVDARLELSAVDSTTNGPLLYRANTGWSETELTWNTRPGLIGGPLGNLGAISAGSRVSYNVTSVVTGPGLYGFGLLPESSDGVDFSSRDTGFLTAPRFTVTDETPLYCSYRGAGGGLTGWARQIGGVGEEELDALATDSAGGFVAAGVFGDAVFPEGRGFALARYAADGTFLWGRVLATDDVDVEHLLVTPQGHIFVAGTYDGSPDLGTGPLPPVSGLGLFFAKFSPGGELLWLRSFVARHPTEGYTKAVSPGEMAIDAEGSLILTGSYVGTLDLGGGPLPPSAEYPFEHPFGFVAKFSSDGRFLWSRGGFTTEEFVWGNVVTSAATDAAGNILIGGHASAESDLGGGPLGASGPFIAKYTPTGRLLWARLFSGLLVGSGVSSVRALDASTVAFTANFGGTFTFGGSSYTGGDLTDPIPYYHGGFLGTLSAMGEDGWLRSLGRAMPEQLAVGPGGTLTVSGRSSNSFDLGGGTLGVEQLLLFPPFAARYSSSGSHLWSRTLDAQLSLPFLGQQPDGSVVLGGISRGSIELEGRSFTPSGPSDLFFLQLRP